MPALGMQQDSGTLLTWLKEEGDAVAEGEPIMEIETDKTTAEVEAPASGVLAGICARKGETVPVGQIVAWVLSPGETVPAGEQHGARGQVTASPVARRLAEEHGVDLSQVTFEGRRIQKDDLLRHIEGQRGSSEARLSPASPKARRLAHERDLDLERLRGTGPSDAVLAVDVLAAVPVGETQARSPSSMWQVMADRVTQSWSGTPHFYLLREVNASRLVAWRASAQQRIEPGPTYTDLLVRVTAAALASHPQLNASWKDDEIVLHREIGIGLAVAVDDGLVVPVIHRANELTLEQIVMRRQELVRRAEAMKLGVEDLANGTFTISNLGMYGVDAFLAILNPPQAALLAVGRIADRIVPIGGQPSVQPMFTLSLSCDHRVTDGARAAQFLDTVASYIEEPLLLYP